MTTRASIESFTSQPALAVVGVSRSGKKFGNYARRTLIEKGYRVYPVHPSGAMIDGAQSYARFADLPEHVDALLVVVPPAQGVQVVRDAAAAGIHHVWLQQGAESPEVIGTCKDLGLQTVAGECILMFTKPTGMHKAHAWVWRVLGRAPKEPR